MSDLKENVQPKPQFSQTNHTNRWFSDEDKLHQRALLSLANTMGYRYFLIYFYTESNLFSNLVNTLTGAKLVGNGGMIHN